jgi:hypothetical protein
MPVQDQGGLSAYFVKGLAYGGKPGQIKIGYLYIVETNYRDILRDTKPLVPQNPDSADGKLVGGGENCGKILVSQQQFPHTIHAEFRGIVLYKDNPCFIPVNSHRLQSVKKSFRPLAAKGKFPACYHVYLPVSQIDQMAYPVKGCLFLIHMD